MARVIVIDDDHSMASRVSAMLRWRGHDVVETADPGRARSIALSGSRHPHVILLGAKLSQACRPPLLLTLRRDGIRAPVLVWGWSREERDVARCFRDGADQYITMPFAMGELLARVEASLARTLAHGSTHPASDIGDSQTHRNVYSFGGIEVNMAARKVYRGNATVHLSPLEFDLLAALLRREGAASSRTDLLREVWKYGPDVTSRTLDTHILNLRSKLEDEPRAPRHILTVRKVGYRLNS